MYGGQNKKEAGGGHVRPLRKGQVHLVGQHAPAGGARAPHGC